MCGIAVEKKGDKRWISADLTADRKKNIGNKNKCLWINFTQQKLQKQIYQLCHQRRLPKRQQLTS